MKKEGKRKSDVVGQALDWRRRFERTRVRTQSEKEKLMLWNLAGVLLTILGAIWMAVTVGSGKVPHRTPGQIIVIAGVLIIGIGAYILFICFCMWANARLKEYRARHDPFHPFCPHCNKYIPADILWECGCCDHWNKNTKSYSFLHKCERCTKSPNRCHCHHCGEIIYLDPKQEEIVNANFIPALPKETIKQAAPTRQDEIEEISFKTMRAKEECARMDAELALEERQWRAKQMHRQRKRHTNKDDPEKRFNMEWDRNMKIHEIAGKHLMKVKEKYKNNPRRLEQEEEFITDWVARELNRNG